MNTPAIRFDIPIRLWQTTLDRDDVDERRRKRATLRKIGRMKWAQAKQAGIQPVGRYMLLITVAGRRENPVLACETVKPLIDAGTDMHIWPDDDPFHRILTCYMRDPLPAPGNRPRITIMIIPIRPRIRPPHCILTLDGLADTRASLTRLTIPDRDWLTSNMRLTPDEREQRQVRVMRAAAQAWPDAHTGPNAAVLCAVRYPDSRDEWQGDPDNTADTATAMWAGGAALGRVPTEPKLFGFYLMEGQAAPHSHDLSMLTLDAPAHYPWASQLITLADA